MDCNWTRFLKCQGYKSSHNSSNENVLKSYSRRLCGADCGAVNNQQGKRSKISGHPKATWSSALHEKPWPSCRHTRLQGTSGFYNGLHRATKAIWWLQHELHCYTELVVQSIFMPILYTSFTVSSYALYVMSSLLDAGGLIISIGWQPIKYPVKCQACSVLWLTQRWTDWYTGPYPDLSHFLLFLWSGEKKVIKNIMASRLMGSRR